MDATLARTPCSDHSRERYLDPSLVAVPCRRHTMKWYDRDAALITAAGACAGIALPLLAAPEQVGAGPGLGVSHPKSSAYKQRAGDHTLWLACAWRALHSTSHMQASGARQTPPTKLAYAQRPVCMHACCLLVCNRAMTCGWRKAHPPRTRPSDGLAWAWAALPHLLQQQHSPRKTR